MNESWETNGDQVDGAPVDPAQPVAELDVDADLEADVEADEREDLLVLESVEETWELPVWEPTGEPRVDEALEGLTRIDMDDVHSHAAVYTDIHQNLRDTLSGLDATS